MSRLVVITGGASGIGQACADRFRSNGDDVVVFDLSDDEHSVDVSDEAAVDAAFAGLPRAPSVLVNAAGIGIGGPILDLDFSTWRTLLSVNLDGAFLCLRAAARQMVAAGEGGVVINITSVNDRWPQESSAAYCTSKAGLSMLTRVAALELGRHGIRVVAIAPGVVDTPLVAAAVEHPTVLAELERRTALPGAMGKPADIGETALFLASAGARWITGEVITVDGGQLLSGLPNIAQIMSATPDTT